MLPPESETVDLEPLDQLLTRFFGAGPAPVKVDFGAASHCGKVRVNNQDHFVVMQRRRSQSVLMSNFPDGNPAAVNEDAYAFAVADGMGGEVFGNLASMLALQAGINLGHYEINWPLKVNEDEVPEALQKLEVYLKLMDQALIRHGHDNPETSGMGTTFTVAYTTGAQAFIGHVGDSRVYLVRDGSMRQLTVDHTLAQEMVKNGQIEPGSTEFLRTNHVLTNCLGGPEEGVYVETHHLQLIALDRLLLCTDGLSNSVAEESILASLLAYPNPQNAAEALIELALEGGGQDNITAVVADFSREQKT